MKIIYKIDIFIKKIQIQRIKREIHIKRYRYERDIYIEKAYFQRNIYIKIYKKDELFC